MPDDNGFNASLRRLRAARGLSQRELAERSGVAAATVSNLERELHGPALAVAVALAGALGVPLADMITEGSRPGALPAPCAGPGTGPFKLTDHDGAVLKVLGCGQDPHGHVQVTSERGVTVSACVEPHEIEGLASALRRACGPLTPVEAAHG